jgi:hypothetical protein
MYYAVVWQRVVSGYGVCVCTVCCAVSPCTAHSTHTIPGHNMLPHHRIIHNEVILPIVLTYVKCNSNQAQV